VKRLLSLWLIATFAGGCVTPHPVDDLEEIADTDPGDLSIDIARNHGILDAIHEIAFQKPDPPSRYPAHPETMNAMLRAVVWKYNHECVVLCMRGYLPKQSCDAPYLPIWIHETLDVAPSLITLHERATELSIRVEELWDAACDEARPRLEHDDWFPLCSIE